MLVNLGKGSFAVLDGRLIVGNEGVGSAPVGMHGVNLVADLVPFRIGEVSCAGVPLGAK
jgi:hypothetical protein